jgi:hypothetical protein
MTTILFVIEPCPPSPHRFLERLADEPGSPLYSGEFGVPYTRFDYMPHAMLGVVTLDHGDVEDLRDAISSVIGECDVSGQLYLQQSSIREAFGLQGDGHLALMYPQLSTLEVLNVDLRGLPQGVDRPFPAIPGWSMMLSEGQGYDVISMGRPSPEASMFPPEPDFGVCAPFDEIYEGSEEVQAVQYIPDLEEDETRDLTDEEVRLFRIDREPDPRWPDVQFIPEVQHFDF